jgi:MoxR-like ATPase
MAVDVIQLGKLVEKELTVLNQIREEIGKVIVGQAELVDRLLIALLCNNHVLIEGVPGLAKTLTITPWQKRSRLPSSVYSSPLTCCPVILSAP